jgi:hypothetical protein
MAGLAETVQRTCARGPVQKQLEDLRLHDRTEPLLQERLERRIDVVDELWPALAWPWSRV